MEINQQEAVAGLGAGEGDTRMTDERDTVFWAMGKLRLNRNVQFTAWRFPREVMQIRNKAKYSYSMGSSEGSPSTCVCCMHLQTS